MTKNVRNIFFTAKITKFRQRAQRFNTKYINSLRPLQESLSPLRLNFFSLQPSTIIGWNGSMISKI